MNKIQLFLLNLFYKRKEEKCKVIWERENEECLELENGHRIIMKKVGNRNGRK